MRDRDIDDVLKRAAGASPEVNRELLGRIANNLGASLQPVRPVSSVGAFVAALVAVCVAAASVSATILGLHGIYALGAVRVAVIFPILLALIFLAALIYEGEMIPGSRRRVAPPVLLVSGCVAFTAVVALLFSDYRTENFLSQGFTCLKAGMAIALPTAAISWWILRRGFAVNSIAAAVAGSTLAGLAGLGMLELHCPNFEAPHIMVWHTSVLALSGLAGGFLASVGRSLRRKRGLPPR
jgi:hypothetical protein